MKLEMERGYLKLDTDSREKEYLKLARNKLAKLRKKTRKSGTFRKNTLWINTL